MERRLFSVLPAARIKAISLCIEMEAEICFSSCGFVKIKSYVACYNLKSSIFSDREGISTCYNSAVKFMRASFVLSSIIEVDW